MGRTATGVKAMALDGDDDCVVGMVCVPKDSEDTIVVVSENGFGKRSRLDDEDGQPIYRVTNRGGKGVKTINVTEKTGKLIAINLVNDSHDLMIINKSGITIRLHMDTIRVMGRATQGVKLIDLQKRNDSIAFVCRVDHESDDNVEEQENEVNETSGTDIANNEQQE
jgi:DNA gyrase subunit A